jgi:hypothetical protein
VTTATGGCAAHISPAPALDDLRARRPAARALLHRPHERAPSRRQPGLMVLVRFERLARHFETSHHSRPLAWQRSCRARRRHAAAPRETRLRWCFVTGAAGGLRRRAWVRSQTRWSGGVAHRECSKDVAADVMTGACRGYRIADGHACSRWRARHSDELAAVGRVTRRLVVECEVGGDDAGGLKLPGERALPGLSGPVIAAARLTLRMSRSSGSIPRGIRLFLYGHGWFRTSDLSRVKRALSR